MVATCRLFLAFILMCLISFNGYSKSKPVLNVVGEEWRGVTNADGTGTYFDLITAALGEDYQIIFKTMSWTRAVELVKRGKADILVGGYEKGLEDLLLSDQHIDTEYPIHLLFDPTHIQPQSTSDLSDKLIAGRKGWGLEFHLPPSSRFYGVESIKDISKLIINKRIDGALTYGYNLHYADPNNELLSIEVVAEMPIYLAFEFSDRGKHLKATFDNRMKELIDNDELRALFKSEADYSHARLEDNGLAQVNWHLVPKIFSKESGNLEVVPWELETSQYIGDLLSDAQLSFKLASSKETKVKLASQKSTCAINFRKPQVNQDNILFSQPFHAFIKPRLFLLENSKYINVLTSMMAPDEISLNDTLTRNPPLRLAIQNNFGIHKTLNTALSSEAFSNMLTIENTGFENLVKLVEQGRIDGIIIWPSIVSDLHNSRPNAAKLRSYGLKEFEGKNIYTHMACHNDEVGNEIISQINEILSNKTHQQKIYGSQINKMDVGSAAAYIRSLNLKVIQRLDAVSSGK